MKIQLGRLCSFLALIVFCTVFFGCGSGGSSTSGRSSKVKTSLKTAGLVSPGTLVATLEVIIAIPYGVTVELDPVSQQPARSVVTLVGTTDPTMTMSALDYVAPTSSAKGSLKISYVVATGFTPSDSIAITLDIANGFFPVASDFSLTKFEIGTMSADGTSKYPIAPVPNPNSLLTVTVI